MVCLKSFLKLFVNEKCYGWKLLNPQIYIDRPILEDQALGYSHWWKNESSRNYCSLLGFVESACARKIGDFPAANNGKFENESASA